MKIRTLKPNEAERIFELFKSASVTRNDLSREQVPNSGFYEYPLTAEDISLRLKEPGFSIALADNDEILAYVIAYQLETAGKNGLRDPVLTFLQDRSPDSVYIDQLFLRRGLPLYFAGRLIDSWDHIVQGEKIPSVACAIPQKPWKNEGSNRMAAWRGYRREGFVDEGDVTLGVFTKPYYEVAK